MSESKHKPYADSCLRNQQAILDTLKLYFQRDAVRCFELGSGTGQHAVFVTKHCPNIEWQPSDLPECIAGIQAWVDDAACNNLLSPLAYDVNAEVLIEAPKYDYVFTANTLHYVSETTGGNILRVASQALVKQGMLFIYGPFNDAGAFTSEGNRHLNDWLLQRDSESGVRDIQWVKTLAAELGLVFRKDYEMPANNLMLAFEKD